MSNEVFINPYHKKIFTSTAFELIVRGGAGAGKTYSIADKIVMYDSVNKLSGNYNKLKTMVVRKTLPSLKTTCIEVIKNECEKFGLPWRYNGQDNIAFIGDNQILFRSLNNSEDYNKIKSITDLDILWLEEANEIRENDYEQLVMRVRGGTGIYSQCILSFNPVGKHSWLYKRFYEKGIQLGKKQDKLQYTVDHNPFINQDYKDRLNRLADHDRNLYNIYRLGEWGELEGIIYEWDIKEKPKNTSEVFYGLDFGFSIDPCVLVRVYRCGNDFHVEELIYQTGLTNNQLADKMRSIGINLTDEIYADSAEPKSIQELFNQGFNVHPCDKGKDYKKFAIDYLRSLNIHIVEHSENIIKEQKSYVWKKDKDGNSLPVPTEYNDHAMDAILYAINTHTRNRMTPATNTLSVQSYKESFNY